MQLFNRNSVTSAGAALLLLASGAVAHGHDEDMNMVTPSLPAVSSNSALPTEPESYFQYGEHTGLLAAHILFMTIGWVFVLPIGKRNNI